MTTAHTTTPLLYKIDKDLPIFECGKKEQYKFFSVNLKRDEVQ